MQVKELEKYFQEELFLPELHSKSKDDVLEELVESLVKEQVVKNKTIILETLKKREMLGSTGIGKGIAVPHCRTLAVPNVTIVIGISEKGIDFEAVDDKPVHIFFLITAPPQDKMNLYLPILGKIVEIVRDTKMRKLLLDVKTFADFKTVLKKVN